MLSIRSSGLTFFVYIGVQPARLIGAVQSGETNLTTTFTTSNTKSIYSYTSAGVLQSFSPGNTFSPLKTLTPGQGYAIAGKSAFSIPDCFPASGATEQSQLLAAIQAAIVGGPSTGDRWLTETGGYWLTETGEYWLVGAA